MAYATKYRGEWAYNANSAGHINIQQEGYVGPIIPITLEQNAFNFSNAFADWETPIIGLRCEIFINNDKDDYFELFELLTATDREFKVILVTSLPSSVTIFEGFVNVNASIQGYLNFKTIYLVASSYMSKLQFLQPASLDTVKEQSFINLIDEMLTSLGVNYNIRVNCKLYADGDTLAAGQTLFNKNGILSEAFWLNDTDRMDSFSILTEILKSFNCSIYWKGNYWYIEHYTDIWQTSIDYVEYMSGVTYGPQDAGSVVNISRAIQDVHALVFRDTSQEVKTTPGVRLLQIRLNSGETLLLNLLSSLERIFLPPITNIPIIPASPFPYAEIPNPPPDIREWLYLSQNSNLPITWHNSGVPQKVIANSVRREHAYDTRNMGLLLGTSFASTVIPSTDGTDGTAITLSFKYADGLGEVAGVSPQIWNIYYFTFGFVLSFYEGSVEKYIVMKPAKYSITGEDEWYVTDLILTAYTWQPQVDVEATSFDIDNISCEIKIMVPLGLVASAEGLNDSYLSDNNIEKYNITMTGEKLWKRFNNGPRDRFLSRLCYYGDFKIATSNDIDFNLIEGRINTNFLDKKEISLLIADNANVNYTNGILRGDDLDIRTILWTRDAVIKRSLIDWYILEKFRLYNSTKQAISSSISQTVLLPPFSLFTESKQGGKKFVLANQSYSPSIGTGEISIEEYDNETDIELIDA